MTDVAVSGPPGGECPDCGAPDGHWCRPWCPWFKGGES